MWEMAADNRHKELLDAIGKVRRQKQRPSVERIYAAMRREHANVTSKEVTTQLDDAVRCGAVVCVESKGAVSYRERSSCSPSDVYGKRQRCSSDTVNRSVGQETISEAVVLAVAEIGSGCSQAMIEQHVKKNCPHASRLPYADLRGRVTDACSGLVSARRCVSRDGLFYLKSGDDSTVTRASSTSNFTADGQLPTTTVGDSQVLTATLCCTTLHLVQSVHTHTLPFDGPLSGATR